MKRVNLPLLVALAATLGGCDLERMYELENPDTGQHVACSAWANTPFDAGHSSNPEPFQNCIATCEAHGFKPTKNYSDKAERGTEEYPPASCR
jgi:hypothetical protein